ncbi:GntR family transcriptional regulator [Nocardia speluncae]|uniref:GntR family transcriptional regulator n=1 Tax=Nocardia speluncae TaxID=419477 RepID=A0A846XM26_9NOCA|nr:GntR family transcriptional regulator [Nocardia speluncae]NKY35603.1 GntR family transcriptional regulator [Nocardia speluncae]
MTMSRPTADRRLDRTATFAHRTESVLRDMVLDGTLKPGERLNEVALAAELGISRGPLREAIQRLVSEGLLTVISHRGAFVRTFTRQEVVDLYELRAALELHAVRLLCRTAGDDDLADLEALLKAAQEHVATTADTAYPAELDFHLQIVVLTNNQALLSAALETQRLVSLARTMSANRPTRAREAVAEHEDLVTALKKRDPERAVRCMEDHLRHSMESALAALGLPDDERDNDE